MLVKLHLCVLYGSKKKTATFALYYMNWRGFITETEGVSCTVRIESLYNTDTIRL